MSTEPCFQSFFPAAFEMFVFLHLQVKLHCSRRCYLLLQIMLIFSLFFLHQLCVVLCNLQRGAKKLAAGLSEHCVEAKRDFGEKTEYVRIVEGG